MAAADTIKPVKTLRAFIISPSFRLTATAPPRSLRTARVRECNGLLPSAGCKALCCSPMKGISPRQRMLSLRHKARLRAIQREGRKVMPEFRRRLTSLGRAALWIAAAVQLAGLAACGGGGY